MGAGGDCACTACRSAEVVFGMGRLTLMDRASSSIGECRNLGDACDAWLAAVSLENHGPELFDA